MAMALGILELLATTRPDEHASKSGRAHSPTHEARSAAMEEQRLVEEPADKYRPRILMLIWNMYQHHFSSSSIVAMACRWRKLSSDLDRLIYWSDWIPSPISMEQESRSGRFLAARPQFSDPSVDATELSSCMKNEDSSSPPRYGGNAGALEVCRYMAASTTSMTIVSKVSFGDPPCLILVRCSIM